MYADITTGDLGWSATGGSAMQAIDVLLSHGVQEEKILFLNLVRCRYVPMLLSRYWADFQGLLGVRSRHQKD